MTRSIRTVGVLLLSLLMMLTMFSVTTFAATAKAPSSVTVSVSKNTATVKWTKVSGAKSYDLQYKTKTATSWKSVNTKNTSYKLTLKSDTNYQVRVRSVVGKSKSGFRTKSFKTGTSDADTIKKLKSEISRLKTTNANEVAKLQAEIKTLKSSNSKLKDENASLKTDYSALKAENESLKGEIEELKAKNSSLMDEIKALKEQLEKPFYVGTWYWDDLDKGSSLAYMLNEDGTVLDIEGRTGTYTVDGDTITVDIPHYGRVFTVNGDTLVSEAGGKTYEFRKSEAVPEKFLGKWIEQGEGVWMHTVVSEDGTFMCYFKDVAPSGPVPYHIKNNGESIVFGTNEFKLDEYGRLVNPRNGYNVKARYMNIMGEWICDETEDIIYLRDDAFGDAWYVEGDTLTVNGEDYTIDSESETFISEDGEVYHKYTDTSLQ